MLDIEKRDRRLLLRELVRPAPLAAAILLGWFFLAVLPFPQVLSVWLILSGAVAVLAMSRARKKRFRHSRFRALWEACEDRNSRLKEALNRLAKSGSAEFTELPKTVDGVKNNLYVALRRADELLHELTESEGAFLSAPGAVIPPPLDPQAKELFRVANLNNQEYRQRLREVMGMIERAEAQAAVYTSALDALRVKLLGMRLGPASNEESSRRFLETMTEARMQLDAIDKALDELELTPFPKTITHDVRAEPSIALESPQEENA
jgi:hypothetical protein